MQRPRSADRSPPVLSRSAAPSAQARLAPPDRSVGSRVTLFRSPVGGGSPGQGGAVWAEARGQDQDFVSGRGALTAGLKFGRWICRAPGLETSATDQIMWSMVQGCGPLTQTACRDQDHSPRNDHDLLVSTHLTTGQKEKQQQTISYSCSKRPVPRTAYSVPLGSDRTGPGWWNVRGARGLWLTYSETAQLAALGRLRRRGTAGRGAQRGHLGRTPRDGHRRRTGDGLGTGTEYVH